MYRIAVLFIFLIFCIPLQAEPTIAGEDDGDSNAIAQLMQEKEEIQRELNMLNVKLQDLRRDRDHQMSELKIRQMHDWAYSNPLVGPATPPQHVQELAVLKQRQAEEIQALETRFQPLFQNIDQNRQVLQQRLNTIPGDIAATEQRERQQREVAQQQHRAQMEREQANQAQLAREEQERQAQEQARQTEALQLIAERHDELVRREQAEELDQFKSKLTLAIFGTIGIWVVLFFLPGYREYAQVCLFNFKEWGFKTIFLISSAAFVLFAGSAAAGIETVGQGEVVAFLGVLGLPAAFYVPGLFLLLGNFVHYLFVPHPAEEFVNSAARSKDPSLRDARRVAESMSGLGDVFDEWRARNRKRQADAMAAMLKKENEVMDELIKNQKNKAKRNDKGDL